MAVGVRGSMVGRIATIVFREISENSLISGGMLVVAGGIITEILV